MADGTVSWFVGVDWGSEKHQVCLLDAAGQVVGERAFRHGGAGLAALCDWLVSVAGDPGLVAVAIEVPHGPVVDALLDRGFAVHAINPKQLERLRDRISLAGAKDDRRDARVAAGGCARTRTFSFPSIPSTPPLSHYLSNHLREQLQQSHALNASATSSGATIRTLELSTIYSLIFPLSFYTFAHPFQCLTPAHTTLPSSSIIRRVDRAGAWPLASVRHQGGRGGH